ncbi:MAG: hypothetical protein QOJ00_2896 [Actinomycetota bacterium]
MQSERLTKRLHEVQFASQALGRASPVRILVPDAFDGSTRLPVLYLLHGGADDGRSWTDKGAAESVTEGLDLIVVMPDCGQAGWYSDWVRDAENTIGRQQWETYHLAELRPWVEETFATRTDRAGRTIAGLSMGGFGAMKYAARHPELFGFAAAFSGATDILDDRIGKTVDAMTPLNGGAKGDVWGPYPESIPTRREHNPVDLAENLRHTVLELRTGNGRLFDDGPVLDTIEAGVHRAMTTFHARLDDLGIDHVWHDYGAGLHDWPYWTRALAQTLPGLMRSTRTA